MWNDAPQVNTRPTPRTRLGTNQTKTPADDYAPGLQTDCQYIDLRTGDNLVECVETELEEETVLVPPEGQDACIVILEVGELSDKCAELGHVLEYEFRFAGDPPEDFAVEVDCSMPSVVDYCDGASCYGPGIDQLD